jgi:hypothetical protein
VKLYVATKFENAPEAREVMAVLTAAGHTITHDWTKEAVDPSWTPAQQYVYLQTCGAADLVGVENADALVLVNHPYLRDGMAEFGYAMGLGKDVFVLYPERRSSVFFHRAWLADSMEELISLLARVGAST